MAEGDAGYNPIEYYVGTVWPHDNAIIPWGLRRCWYRKEAAQLALAMLEAAAAFRGRLPEAFAGALLSLEAT
jgi:glycogen debranching enzyme